MPLLFTQEEITLWSPLTQAKAKIADAHFAVFGLMEKAKSKRERTRYLEAMETLRRAFDYLSEQQTGAEVLFNRAEAFFYDNAGWSWDRKLETAREGRIRSAKKLARAEKWAYEHSVEFDVVPDSDADLSFMTKEQRKQPHECVGVIARFKPYGDLNEQELTESLWGIIDADDNYLRVVKAELTLELMPTTERRVA
jgi:hypothetical protein